MANRFDQLEFDEPEREPQPAHVASQPVQQRAALKDAGQFLAQAEADFHAHRHEQALRHYAKALDEQSTLVQAWLGQVRTLIELNELDEARLWADKALELFPQHPDLLAAKAVAAVRSRSMQMALVLSDAGLAQPNASPYAWVARGEVLLAAKRNAAHGCFEKALGAEPDPRRRAWWQCEIARILRRYRQFAHALLRAHEAVTLLAEEAGAWLEYGLCQQALKLAEARGSLERALALDANLSAAQYALDHGERWGFLRRLFGRKGAT